MFNIDSRPWRTLGFVLPSIVASLFLYVPLVVPDVGRDDADFEKLSSLLGALLMYSFVLVGLQSLIFTLTMEFVIRPRRFKLAAYLAISCGLGLISGAGVLLVHPPAIGVVPLGGLVGVLVSLVVCDWRFYRNRE